MKHILQLLIGFIFFSNIYIQANPKFCSINPIIEVKEKGTTNEYGHNSEYPFGGIPVRAIKTVNFLIENRGTSDIIIDSIQISKDTGIFTITKQPDSLIQVASNPTEFSIRFSPRMSGNEVDTLKIFFNDDRVHVIRLMGTGLAPDFQLLDEDLVSINNDKKVFFGETKLGDSTLRKLRIHNAGAFNLRLIDMPEIKFVNDTLNEFEIIDFSFPTNSIIEPGSENDLELNIQFKPRAIRIRNALLQIRHDDTLVNISPFKISLEGVGLESCYDIIQMPNAFTPFDTSPSYNDVFRPVIWDSNSMPKNYKLYIYNRENQLLFISDHPDEGWDGTCANEKAKSGKYIYKIKYECEGSNEIIEEIGSFLLITY